MDEKNNNIETIRHSLSHVLAAAVLELYPDAKLGIGPAIDNGFYYDFDFAKDLIPEDLPKIEKKMHEIIKKDTMFEKEELDIDSAIKLFSNQPYKVELITDLKSEKEDKVSTYKTGEFIDLCKGPHAANTLELENIAFELDKIAGAYWKGDEKNKMLQRIYALAFGTKDELEKYLEQRKEAKKRDHRKIGKELELFSFHEEGPGMPFWHPKGLLMFDILVDRWRKIQKEHGYREVRLPILLDVELWKRSGHFDHYKDGMFFTENEGKKLALRPMDCPGAILYYQEKLHSYQEMPIRLSELGTVYRKEQSGELHGLMRVQSITQDDAHIFITEEMIEEEIIKVIKIMEEIYQPFDLERKVYLSTRPDDAMGDIKIWQKAENALQSALDKNKIKYNIKEKDGAFYGPKIDIEVKDSLGRSWQTGTIQLDFFMPERFELEYVAKDGNKKRPVMIHRALMGSLERFIGIITEHYAGVFPIWLAPIQVIVLPISDKHVAYAKQVAETFKNKKIRVEIDDRTESIGKKIREAEMQKIPYMLIVGDKEVESKKVSVREYGSGDKGQKEIKYLVEQVSEQD